MLSTESTSLTTKSGDCQRLPPASIELIELIGRPRGEDKFLKTNDE